MASRSRRLQFLLHDEHLRDADSWPSVDEESLSPEKREVFRRRKQAVVRYMVGAPAEEITADTGVSRSEIHRLLGRCAKTHPDGMIFGFRALIPNKRVRMPRPPSRLTGSGRGPGLLAALFEAYPEIEMAVRKEWLGKSRREAERVARPALGDVHKAFLRACGRAGIAPDAYPFSHVKKGRQAIRVFLKRLEDEAPTTAVLRAGGTAAARHWASTGATREPKGVLRPFAEVQLDGHKLDLRCIVTVVGQDGLPVDVALERFWILVLQESASRAVLSYWICLRREYGEEDVLRTIQNSLQPWTRRSLSIPGLSYLPGAGLPSGVIPRFRSACFDLIRLDNALSHRAHRVRDRLIEVIGATVNYGPAGTPELRSLIERYFKTLSTQIHRMPSTTGNRPGDPRGRQAAEKAVQLKVTLEHLEEVLDVLIANYNASVHGELGRTPLDHLRYFAELDTSMIRSLAGEFARMPSLFQTRIVKTVKGSVEKGRRPYVELLSVRYQNETLAGLPSLIGQEVSLLIDTEDLRFVRAYLPDGSFLGELRAHGQWSVTAHSIRTRRAINAARRGGVIHFSAMQNPVDCWRDHLASQAKKRSAAANEYARLKRHGSTQSPPAREEPPEERSTESKSSTGDWTPRRKSWISITD